MKLFAAVVVAGVLVSTVAVAKMMDPASYAMMRVTEAAHCTDRAAQAHAWCLAGSHREGHAAALVPGTTLVGTTIEIGDDTDVADAIAHQGKLAVLAIGADHAVELTTRARTPAEITALTSLAAVFDGDAKPAQLPHDVARDAKAVKADHTAKLAGKVWTWTGEHGEIELTKLDGFWIAIEIGPWQKAAPGHRHPPEPTVWMTILTEAWQ